VTAIAVLKMKQAFVLTVYLRYTIFTAPYVVSVVNPLGMNLTKIISAETAREPSDILAGPGQWGCTTEF